MANNAFTEFTKYFYKNIDLKVLITYDVIVLIIAGVLFWFNLNVLVVLAILFVVFNLSVYRIGEKNS